MYNRPSFLMFCFFVVLTGTFGCESAEETTLEDQSSAVQAHREGLPEIKEATSHQRTRGPEPQSILTAEDSPSVQPFSALSRILDQETSLEADLTEFASRILAEESIRSEEDLLTLLEQRDSSLIPRLEDVLMRLDGDQQLYDAYDMLQRELQALGMQMTFAEGMLTSVGPYPVLQQSIEKYASPGFKLLLRFREAQTDSYNGEYPYLHMQPYIDMIEIGQAMSKLSDSTHFQAIRQDFEHAVLVVSDIHLVSDPVARDRAGWFVSDVSTDYYPYATEIDTRQVYSEQKTGSLFQEAMAKVLLRPSSMSMKPSHLYLVITGWADDRESAASSVVSHMIKGKDIPHHLEIHLPDGSSSYALVYRFFEEEAPAEAAILEATSQFPDAQLMMVSFSQGKLYQIGG